MTAGTRVLENVVLAAVVLSACAGHVTRAVIVPRQPMSLGIDVLLAQLTSSRPEARELAAWELARAGQVEAEVIEALRRAQNDPVEAVRDAAAWALSIVRGPGWDPAALYDRPPTLRVQTRPIYPQGAFDKRIQGTVVVEILVGESGKVAHAEIRESIPALDEAALRCVRQWTFNPGTQAGRPVAVHAMAPVMFRIY